MVYQDHFSQNPEAYRAFRPDYPESLYDFLYQHVIEFNLAWDCATGNGQAAQVLAKRFHNVIATDLSEAQLKAAPQINNVEYRCERAEKTSLKNHTVDLITIAQALHWLDLLPFYNEVKRVGTQKAVLAAWCYSLAVINPEIDAQVQRLYEEILGTYWPKERKYIDKHYENIYFPFEKILAPKFRCEKQMDLPAFIGYLNTWSAVKEYQKVTHHNPVDLIQGELVKLWDQETMQVSWPIHMLVAKI